MFRTNKITTLLWFALASVIACKVSKNNSSSKTPVPVAETRTNIPKKTPLPAYQEAATRFTDIEHMNLWVRFDYEKQHVIGKVALTCKPYFYPLTQVQLDARGFEIHRVALLKKGDTSDVVYTYANDKLTISLDTTYTRTKKFVIYIDYTAKPNAIKGLKGKAITDDKGLYFINPTGRDTLKPRQIWTQGETQSNSCWFPTNDVPNEKITQDLAITVDDKDITLSNGELMRSKLNADGTRTDFWRQTKPHAPYLVMLAVGEFAMVKDYWRDSIPVDYYVEPSFKKYAKMVFGRTPEMMEVFSQKLGVDYPWDKYSQIVVRDFVSGAMENTSAVVHFEGLQHDEREHLDNTHEDIIVHELFHHWFGDLVTCESWSNIPLNESFATYGEYIWNEAAYGRMEADYELSKNLWAYLGQTRKHSAEPIRYHYHSRDDMFDVVSYQKGSLILHALRKHVGDEAFFASLKLYLTQYAYKTVELANLRMAFEEVTGQDLHWFFNQWFLRGMHAKLSTSYQYNEDRTQATVFFVQSSADTKAEYLKFIPYQLPLHVDVYTANGVKRIPFELKSVKDSIVIKSSQPIDFIIPDAERVVLGEFTDYKTPEQQRMQAIRAPLYLDKYYAVKSMMGYAMVADSLHETYFPVIDYLLAHPHYGVRKLGVDLLNQCEKNYERYEPLLVRMAASDSTALIRASAIELLSKWNGSRYLTVFEKALQDQAYSVVAAGLEAMADADSVMAYQKAISLKQTSSARVQLVVADLIARQSTQNEVAYFGDLLVVHPRLRRSVVGRLAYYLPNKPFNVQLDAVNLLEYLVGKLGDERFKEAVSNLCYVQTFYLEKRAEQLKSQRTLKDSTDPQANSLIEKELECAMLIDAYNNLDKTCKTP